MAHRDGQAEGITQLVLEVLFPGPEIVTVAAASVGEDQHLAGMGIRQPAAMAPPVFQAIDRKFGCVSGYSHCNVPGIFGEIVDAKRNCHTSRIAREVRVDLDRLATPAFSLSSIVSDELLLFCINADDGKPFSNKLCFKSDDVLELLVAVRMLSSCLLLLVDLQ